MKFFKQILLAVVVGFFAVVLVNFGFFYARVKFWIAGPSAEVATETLIQAGRELGMPDSLSIPSLGIVAPIVRPDSREEKVFQDFLTRGVVRFPGSSEVGQVGNAYIFGHSSDLIWKSHEYKNIFALLPEIQIGAQILVTDFEGRLFTYRVLEKFVAEKDFTQVLSQETGGKAILTLQTSYPVGSAAKRYIVRAVLDSDGGM